MGFSELIVTLIYIAVQSPIDRPIKKSGLVKHFKDQYQPPSIYRELKKLVESGLASDSMEIINKVPIGADWCPVLISTNVK